MKILLAGIAAIIVLVAAAFAFAPRAHLETAIRIDATPDAVWSVLADGASYGEWNPFIVAMRGEVTTGARLENTLRPQPGSEMVFSPLVLKAERGRELRWLGRLLLPRIFDGEHYFLLERDGDGTLLTHGEHFTGIALWFIDTESFRENFEAMNAALKARVESREL